MKRRYVTFAKKALAVLLALLCVGAASPMAFATDTTEKNYIIEHPYEGIDWTAGAIIKLSFTATQRQVTVSLPLTNSVKCTMRVTTIS